jgi:hypothetical protein
MSDPLLFRLISAKKYPIVNRYGSFIVVEAHFDTICGHKMCMAETNEVTTVEQAVEFIAADLLIKLKAELADHPLDVISKLPV